MDASWISISKRILLNYLWHWQKVDDLNTILIFHFGEKNVLHLHAFDVCYSVYYIDILKSYNSNYRESNDTFDEIYKSFQTCFTLLF